jgi:hypothetical protein
VSWLASLADVILEVVDRVSRRRKARREAEQAKPAGLSWKAVEHRRAQERAGARSFDEKKKGP